MTRSIDPASRDYTRARHRLPREQREVWGAPVRDGTCADPDECDRHFDCPGARVHDVEDCWRDAARDAKPLIAGGQGRSEAETSRAADIVAWSFGIAGFLAAVALVLYRTGVLS